MKKTLLFLIAIITCGIALAQEGEIIYREPNLTRYLSLGSGYRLKIDTDQDGQNEWQFDCVENYHLVCLLRFSPVSNDYENWTLSFAFWNADHDTLRYGDTLTDIAVWASPTIMGGGTWLEYHPQPWVSVPSQSYWPSAYVAVRRKIDEDSYCYGWIEVEVEYSESGDYIKLTLLRHAYCTIPNYPLRVGQEDFTWAIDENEIVAFATVHPNPTTGVVRIIGKDLKAAEVVNTLGQRVATTHGKGDQMTIDIANLPEGVYFVRITNEQGRKCVRKVVKE